jgi:G3E family GTPase
MLKTPCNAVAGFLGSGKTTLLRNSLEQVFQEKRVAIIMNEIGDLGIDGKVVSGFEAIDKVVELNSGCVCCSVDIFSLHDAFREIQEQIKPDLIVIETTGLADPFPLIQRLHYLDVILDAVITLVDASEFLRLAAEEAVLNEQVRAADFLILNKTDLVTESEIEQVESYLRQLNQRAPIFRTTHSNIDPKLLFALGANLYRKQSKLLETQVTKSARDSRQSHQSFTSFSYQTERMLNLDKFKQFLSQLSPKIYRAKGLLNLDDRVTACLFNFTGGRFDFQAVSPEICGKMPTQAVFIGRNLEEEQTAIIQQLQACEDR